ncbi:respirasome Complex Assembly Factor 1 isoform X1 [Triticum aestivum]|uniref:respirasome Complex Assembly Factor 1 isoform X1 n=1 Tax=Triticum aestivum TaxID=4565 RepID=UPI001D02F3BC|nr:respirasome Complex Assembly Factor 1-like isoform X1 [Triticum aestivum]
MRKSKAAAAAAKQPHHAAQNGHALPSRLARYLDPDASLDKDQLLDAVHWIRQAVGLACGLLWGAVPLVGVFWIALFFTISTVIVHLYYAHLLKIDEEDFGGHAALLQEGLFASFTLFLLAAFMDSSIQLGSLLRSPSAEIPCWIFVVHFIHSFVQLAIMDVMS